MAPRLLSSLHRQNGLSKAGTMSEGFVYGNAKGMLMRLTRGPLSSHSGSFHSQEPLPLQEPPRTWISLNTMEIKHFLINGKIWTLEGPRQWFSKCNPGTRSVSSTWELTGHAQAAKFTTSSKVWKSVLLQRLCSVCCAQGKCPCPAEAGTDQRGQTEHTTAAGRGRSTPWVSW